MAVQARKGEVNSAACLSSRLVKISQRDQNIKCTKPLALKMVYLELESVALAGRRGLTATPPTGIHELSVCTPHTHTAPQHRGAARPEQGENH